MIVLPAGLGLDAALAGNGVWRGDNGDARGWDSEWCSASRELEVFGGV